MRILWPWSLLRKSMLFADMDPNDRRSLEVEIPAGNGVGTARAIARAYSAFAEGGAELGITPATLASLTAVHDVERPRDEVMGVPSWMSLGFLRPGPRARLRLEPARLRHAGRRRLVRLRRSRRTARLRLRDEQHGLLHVRRPAREGAARCRAPLHPAALRLKPRRGGCHTPASRRAASVYLLGRRRAPRLRECLWRCSASRAGGSEASSEAAVRRVRLQRMGSSLKTGPTAAGGRRNGRAGPARTHRSGPRRGSSASLSDRCDRASSAQRPLPQRAHQDVLDQLRKLGELRDAGVISAQEFEAKKAQLLDRL